MRHETRVQRCSRRVGHGGNCRVMIVAAVLLTGCGGGGRDDGVAPPAGCSVAEQKQWLGTYMDDWYFWYRLSPKPAAESYPDLQSYFEALLYTGSEPAFPPDRFSRSETTESFNRFYGDGSTLGYGVSVTGLEVTGEPTRPLYVRHVEPRSPAAAQGVQRGDEVLSINGRSAHDVIVAEDFSALTASQAGESLTLELRRFGVQRTVTLSAAVFALTPVNGTAVFSTAQGRKLGYVAVKDMIGQALAPLETAFARFRAERVADVVLDLRYNGGGLVSTGGTLASYIAGARGDGRSYATLLYNDKQEGSNQSYRFTPLASALGLPRVFVLIGRRTCSASEQVINGLRGVGVEVVAIGETSCGKPVGSLPAPSCGRTYSVINFESVNDRNEGRYFNGFDATCAVGEDFSEDQGSSTDPLLAVASHFADAGQCPPLAGLRERPLARSLPPRQQRLSDERDTLLPR